MIVGVESNIQLVQGIIDGLHVLRVGIGAWACLHGGVLDPLLNLLPECLLLWGLLGLVTAGLLMLVLAVLVSRSVRQGWNVLRKSLVRLLRLGDQMLGRLVVGAELLLLELKLLFDRGNFTY